MWPFRPASSGWRARRRLLARLRGYLRLASAALLWEELWPALWPAVLIAGTGLALALFDALPLLPGPLHAVVLGLWAIALVIASARALRSIRLPGHAAARRRVERASGLGHRPLQALEDRPAEPALEPDQRALWRAYRRRTVAAITRLRVGVPKAGLAGRDPFGLRIILALALLVGVIDARGDAVRRLERAVSPDLSAFAPPPVSLDLWVTPPAYTGLPPIVLRQLAEKGPGSEAAPHPAAVTEGALQPIGADGGPASAKVPAGSTLLAQVHGGRGTPVLVVDETTLPFERLGEASFKASGKIERSGRVSIRQGRRELAAIDLDVVPDLPPTIRFALPPSGTLRGVLRLDYAARDDYGVVSAKLVIEHRGTARLGIPRVGSPGWLEERVVPGQKLHAERLELPLSVPRPGSDETLTSYQDLTAHPWAGLEVTMWLEATDAVGQTGRSAVEKIVLPERPFTNPVARDIIAARKKLARGLDSREPVAGDLARIADEPERFDGDTVVYLALRSAIGRLLLDPDPSAVPSVEALLWDTALRLEDAGAGTAAAERRLRDAEQALQAALDRGADAKEIERRLEQVRNAMDAYLDALSRGLPPTEEAMVPGMEGAQEYRRQDLAKMLERVRELARSGDAAGARRALSELRDILENLDVPRAESDAAAQAREQMSRLKDVIERQQQLLDRSFQASRRPSQREVFPPGLFPPGPIPPGLLPPEMTPPESAPPGLSPQEMGLPEEGSEAPQGAAPGGEGTRPEGAERLGPGAPDFAGQARDQDQLRHDLGEVMLGLGEILGQIPPSLGQAELAMREATKALENQQPGEAAAAQQKALDQLQRSMENAAQALSQALQGRAGERRPQAGARQDPLGRPLRGEGGADTGTVRIPEEMELRRAREILDELRRRSGDPARPPVERDYIDRLIPRF
jgi:uncharacterized protein (TIGR02302 family)